MGSCPALPLCLGSDSLRLGDVLLPLASFKEKPCTVFLPNPKRVIILLEATKYIRTDVMGNVRAVKTAFSAALRGMLLCLCAEVALVRCVGRMLSVLGHCSEEEAVSQGGAEN